MLVRRVARRPAPCQQASKMVDYSMMMIPDVDCDCIRRCDYLNLSMPAPAVYGFSESVAPSQVFLSPPQVPRPYRAAAKAWVLRAYPRSATWSSDGV